MGTLPSRPGIAFGGIAFGGSQNRAALRGAVLGCERPLPNGN